MWRLGLLMALGAAGCRTLGTVEVVCMTGQVQDQLCIVDGEPFVVDEMSCSDWADFGDQVIDLVAERQACREDLDAPCCVCQVERGPACNPGSTND